MSIVDTLIEGGMSIEANHLWTGLKEKDMSIVDTLMWTYGIKGWNKDMSIVDTLMEGGGMSIEAIHLWTGLKEKDMSIADTLMDIWDKRLKQPSV